MNKLLISVEVPSIEQSYDLFIPINRKIGTVKKVIIKSINELSGGILKDKNYLFVDIDTGIKYENNAFVKASGIKNGARIMLI
ncbi:MAG: hypothetical protein U0M66_01715 [Bacilli bacterium]|nr:hypothetical protein [Bacilli bacterium]